ncbi:MAG: NUDIX hydrolase [Deltaproteobacteria bacterium]|nr:NUDIX hydrolase [Deltaproteobacteria bacterium]
MGSIRSAARAVIVRDGQLLLAHCQQGDHTYFLAPGGGQEPGETLIEAVARECLEEIGSRVKVGRLLFVRDYIRPPQGFSYLTESPHQVEHFFECQVPDTYRPRNGPNPDSTQRGVRWLNAEELSEVNVYPDWLPKVLDSEESAWQSIYQEDQCSRG